MPAPYSALQIAQWFLGHIDREAGDSISNLKLQKLVYYAQAYYLAHTGQPLFHEDMEAWAHGPVAPSVYRAYKLYGWDAIPPPDALPNIDPPTVEFLKSVLGVFGGYTGRALEVMTHSERPWIEARNGLAPEARSEEPISKDRMRDFYRTVLAGE